jgi:hypothetical protein
MAQILLICSQVPTKTQLGKSKLLINSFEMYNVTKCHITEFIALLQNQIVAISYTSFGLIREYNLINAESNHYVWSDLKQGQRVRILALLEYMNKIIVCIITLIGVSLSKMQSL